MTVCRYFGPFVQGEDDRIGQFFFIRTQRTDEVTQTFRKHRDGTVYQVYGSRPLGSLLVDDTAFLDIMRYIGDVYTYFPQSRFQLPDGKGIIEVLGVFRVDGEGYHFPAVFTFRIVFGSDFSRNLFGGCFYVLRVSIR